MKKAYLYIVLSILAALAIYVAIVYFSLGSTPERIWLHRCNSLEKLEEKQAAYPNFEVDLVFREPGIFDVTHDLDKSYGLTIEPFFEHIGETRGRMWLDIKNLSLANAALMLQAINELCETYGVEKEQLIVESPNEEALLLFRENDFYTSYYVKFPKASRLSSSEVDSCIVLLRGVADRGNVNAISFHYSWYKPISEKLNRPSIDLLTWKNHSSEFELRFLPRNWALLGDEQIKVILVKSKGRHHR